MFTEFQDQILGMPRNKMGKGRKLNWFEPKAPDSLDIYLEILQLFPQVRWSEFFHRCSNYHDLVAQCFTQGFDGNRVDVGGLSFAILQSKPLLRPRPYQRMVRKSFTITLWQGLMSPRRIQRPNWRIGVQKEWLQDQWHVPLRLYQQYFSCEGRYNQVNLYDFYLLAHLAGQISINPCFYLLESLKHMAARFRARTNPSSHFIYHKALIKLIIKNQLAKIGRTWSHFIF